MNKSLTTALFSCILLSLCASSLAQTSCTSFSDNALYSNCNDLGRLNSYLHWNFHQSNNTVDIAFRHTSTTTSRWSAWAINPNGQTMLGSQALVAFQNSSGVVHAYTSSIDSYSTSMAQSDLSFQVTNLAARYENSEMIITATLHLSSNLLSTNQVWQEGPVSGDTLGTHPTSGDNVNSVGTVNFQSGQTSAGGGSVTSRNKKRNIHGVLNAVSWGILMPMGAMIARYLKAFKSADPTWFYLHVACQSSAYIVGVAGWGTGLKLGSDSASVQFDTHRTIGIILFCLGTLQVFALLLRPKKDHKFRLYWNIYHYVCGYTTIILSIVNIFEGFDIMENKLGLTAQKNWKKAYIGILIVLGAIAAILEAFTWFVVIKKKKETQKSAYGMNGANGVNGYGARTQPEV